jgi:addiction module RelE/StbE family toxin
MKIVWSERSVADLSEIREFIAKDSEANAAAFMTRLFEAAERLEFLPDQGRRVPEATDLPNLRELLVGNYRVIYRREAERIEVILVIHGRRDLAATEPKPWRQ